MSLGVLAEILDPKEVIQEAYSPKHLTQRKNNQFMDLWDSSNPNGWYSVMHGAFVFRNVTRNFHELILQIIRNLKDFVIFLALNKSADHVHAIGQEIFMWSVACFVLAQRNGAGLEIGEVKVKRQCSVVSLVTIETQAVMPNGIGLGWFPFCLGLGFEQGIFTFGMGGTGWVDHGR
ncbi:unnamed protein product [Prunus armeniaca]|uniref:Uncharacterized protein n=1 Tax=Prunus armeniaca TaxID=36596 RepID=A0A6J5V8A5_PRUAR|nr:unnamed protein product [Prunus armeniaca]